MANGNKELIRAEAIEDGAVTTEKISNGSITVEKLHPSAASGVLENSIDTIHLKNYCITDLKIAPLSVNNSKITTDLDVDKVDGCDVETILTPDSNNFIPTSQAVSNHININNRIGSSCKLITDWNNASENGWFYSEIGSLNSPIDKLIIGKVIVYNNDWIIQEVIDFTSDDWQRMDSIYKRMKRNGVWSSWKSEIDLYYPVGERYVQLPEADGTFSSVKSPDVKFGGAWNCIFDNEGVFFRTEGGNANEARSNGLQADQIKSHRHGIGGATDSGSNGSTGAQLTRKLSTIYTNYDGGTETRPINRLMKIWERFL